MKKLYTFIVTILLLLGSGYFLLNEYAPKTLDNIRETVQDTAQNIDFVQKDIGDDLLAGINTNIESNLAMVIKAPR